MVRAAHGRRKHESNTSSSMYFREVGIDSHDKPLTCSTGGCTISATPTSFEWYKMLRLSSTARVAHRATWRALLSRPQPAFMPVLTRTHCDSTIAPDAKRCVCAHASLRAHQCALRRLPAVAHPCCRPAFVPACSVTVSFVDKTGKSVTVTGKEGQNLVHLAHENGVELEGACECSLACSTCHVILPEEVYSKLDSASEEEEDLLDLAFGLTSTSRLGCQVVLSTHMEGAKIRLPAATRNFYVDGHTPKPH